MTNVYYERGIIVLSFAVFSFVIFLFVFQRFEIIYGFPFLLTLYTLHASENNVMQCLNYLGFDFVSAKIMISSFMMIHTIISPTDDRNGEERK